MKTIPSRTGAIHIGDIADGLDRQLDALRPSGVLLLADENTARHCLPRLGPAFHDFPICVLPPGEAHKTLDSCQRVWGAMVAHRLDRESVLVNLGGGMITDLGGFAAACYQRGIRFVHIPTSLLGMADAAIGGKTGVDFMGFKNYIGAFRAPEWIWIDPGFLRTLPEAEMRNGLAECVKHAIIGSAALWQRLAVECPVPDGQWTDLLADNAQVKCRIVDEDPEEQGLRKALNFGHTIGHALESHFLDKPRPLSHGEAVALGMLAESCMAHQKGLLGEDDFSVITEIIDWWLTPVRTVIPTFAALEPWLLGDKKKRAGRVGFSLPDRIGHCLTAIPATDDEIKQALAWLNHHLAHGPDRPGS
jgi:3-dehydroquinate synthase